MSDKEQKQQITFLKGTDKNLHDNILHLDKKLKGLLKAIELKMENSSSQGDELTATERKQLPELANEVKKALDSIQNLVNTVVPKDLTRKEFAEMNYDNLESLRTLFQVNADKITKIEEKF